jgi:hypothetical protein
MRRQVIVIGKTKSSRCIRLFSVLRPESAKHERGILCTKKEVRLSRHDINSRLLKKAEAVIARSEATKQSPSFSEGEIASLPPVARNDTCLFLFQHPARYDFDQ